MNTTKPNKTQVFFNIITFLIVCLLCSYPLWFLSMKHFLYVYIPNVFSMFINPKCLFIVGNIIIVILVRESKVSSSTSPLDTKIYRYQEHNENGRINGSARHSINVNKREDERELEKKIILIEDIENRKDDDQENDECQGEKENVIEEQEVVHDQVEEEIEDGEDGLPHEELTRRVEDFIARVNRQRWLEANLVACFGS